LCPRLPSAMMHEHDAPCHLLTMAGVCRCGQLRALCRVGRNSASSAVDGLRQILMVVIICAAPASVSAGTLPLQLQQPLLLLRLLRRPRSSIMTRIPTATSARSSDMRFAFFTKMAGTKHTSQRAFPVMSALCATGWLKRIRTTLLAVAVPARLMRRWIPRSHSSLVWSHSPLLASSSASLAWMSASILLTAD